MKDFSESGKWWPEEVKELIESQLGEGSVTRFPAGYTLSKKEPLFAIDCKSRGAAEAVKEFLSTQEDTAIPTVRVGSSDIDVKAKTDQSVFFKLSANPNTRSTQVLYLAKLLPHIVELREKEYPRATQASASLARRPVGLDMKNSSSELGYIAPERHAEIMWQLGQLQKTQEAAPDDEARTAATLQIAELIGELIPPQNAGGMMVVLNEAGKLDVASPEQTAQIIAENKARHDERWNQIKTENCDRYFDSQVGAIVTQPAGYMAEKISKGSIRDIGPGTYIVPATGMIGELTVANYDRAVGSARGAVASKQ